MFQEKYRRMNEQIVPHQSLVNETIEKINQRTKPGMHRGKPFFCKPTAAGAMLLICIFAAMPVLAAKVTPVYELIYLVSPSTAQFFKPVQKSCENNGIKMEVVATYIHEDTAEIYITLQDLTGSRVDATTDLYDSYSIHRPFAGSAYCKRIDYDKETKTATFLIKITQWGKHNIEGDKLTFSIHNFISDKHEYEGIPIKVNLGTVNKAAETKDTEITGGSGVNYERYFPYGKTQVSTIATVLAPSELICSPVKGIDITGIGYVDGMLHIQAAVSDSLKNDNHGYSFLKDKMGNEIEYDYSVSFSGYGDSGSKDTRVDYDEFVFDIPKDEIANYTLYGSFYTSGLYTEGPWQVTFPLVEIEREKS